MAVSVNGSALPVQPTTLNESYIQIQTDQTSINGGMTRNRVGQKKQADMEFTIMQPSNYQTIINQFTTGSGVYYSNDQSSWGTFTFSGLPSFSESAYVPGTTLYRPLVVNIREV